MRDDRRRLAGSGPQEFSGPSSVDTLLQSIQTQESGGFRDPVNVRNERTGAHGLFQILPSNWKAWSKEIFGQEVEPTAENQRIVAEAKLSEYTEKFGVEGAAVAWYAGPGRAREWVRNPENPWFDRRHGRVNPKTGQRQEPSVREYVQSVTERMGQVAPPQPQADMGPPVPQGYQPPEPGSQAVGQRMQPPQEPHVEPPAPIQLPSALMAMQQAPSVAPLQQAVAPPQQVEPPQQSFQMTEAEARALLAQMGSAPPQQSPQMTEAEARALLAQMGSAPPPSPMTPRQEGRAAAERGGPISRRLGALVHGAGSMAFGIGTPIVAAGEYLESRLDPRRPGRSFGESLEYARGKHEGFRGAEPVAYYTGMAGGMVGGYGPFKAAASKAPAAVKSVFTLRDGQTARNILKLSATGSVAGGVTAGMEEGAGAAVGGMAMGAAAGPALVGGGLLARGGFRQLIGNRKWADHLFSNLGVAESTRRKFGINPDGPAIRAIAARHKADPRDVAHWYDRYTQAFDGKKPTVAELLDRRTAEEIHMIAQSRVGSKAGGIFREAEERVRRERPGMLGGAVERGGPTTTVVAEEAALGAVPGRAAREVERRAGRTQGGIKGLRDIRMDKGVAEIRDHLVPVSDDMHKWITKPEVMQALPPPMRSEVRNLLEAGQDVGAMTLPVRVWDEMRQVFSLRARSEPGKGYAKMKDKLMSYISKRSDTYGKLMRKYIDRSQIAEGAKMGEGVVGTQTRKFVDLLRRAGGGTAEQARSPRARVMQQTGARQGSRVRLADMLEHDPEGTMERMARDSGFRKNIEAALSPRESRELSALASWYGHQLDRVAGARVGSRVLPQGSTREFQAAVTEASKTPGARTVPASSRGTLSDAIRESPGSAEVYSEALAKHEGLQQRILSALGGEEGGRIIEAGTVAARGGESLRALAPLTDEAMKARSEAARNVQSIIGGAVIVFTKRSSAAFLASALNDLRQMVSMSKSTATRAAEMLTDVDAAPKVIKWLTDQGVTSEQILRLYRNAAAAAGIVVGGQ